MQQAQKFQPQTQNESADALAWNTPIQSWKQMFVRSRWWHSFWCVFLPHLLEQWPWWICFVHEDSNRSWCNIEIPGECTFELQQLPLTLFVFQIGSLHLTLLHVSSEHVPPKRIFLKPNLDHFLKKWKAKPSYLCCISTTEFEKVTGSIGFQSPPEDDPRDQNDGKLCPHQFSHRSFRGGHIALKPDAKQSEQSHEKATRDD